MATEHGIVVKTAAGSAWVKTIKSGACEGCSARGSCHSLSDRGEMEVEAINEAGAQVGDRIVLSFETSSLLKASFLIYVFPILLLIFGAAIGQKMAPYLNLNPSGFSAIIGFSFFIAAVLIMKFKANNLSKKNEYRPKVIKILS
ncbi:MAG: SoxR reducing system RseC family protein [Deltaproteobacteria bacterium]|jgi:sigma-E factor negative regulatory protein RseC|nr:SoxR reducing system RseC family protein [Deltaproteobacteria bacterium]